MNGRIEAEVDASGTTLTEIFGVSPMLAGRIVETVGDVARLPTKAHFARPHRPRFPGQEAFRGRILHAAEYRNPLRFRGKRLVVVGAGDSAVQIAHELVGVAEITLATRTPIRFMPQVVLGRDLHFWLTVCDDANEACPFFPWAREQLHWSFEDPSKAEGTEEERLAVFRSV